MQKTTSKQEFKYASESICKAKLVRAEYSRIQDFKYARI